MLRRVAGDSMTPTLKFGDMVLAVRPRTIRRGDIIIIHHQGIEKIKRVTKVRNYEVFVEGDNALQSTDSRTFGWLPARHAAGKVMLTWSWPF